MSAGPGTGRWAAFLRWMDRWTGRARGAVAAGEAAAPLLSGAEVESLLARLQAMGAGSGPARPMHTHRPGEADSPFVGAGLDFEELRPYAPGDDLRDVDWRAYARSGRAFVKRYREERQAILHIVLDRGASMRFGTRCRLKVAQGAMAAAIFALAGMLRGASVGLSTLGPDETHRRARPGRRAVMTVLEDIIAPCPPLTGARTQPHASFAHGLGELESLVPAGSRVVLLSDFRALREDDLGVLARLAGRCTVEALAIADESESVLPALGAAEFAAPAARGHYTVQTDDAALRESFVARAHEREQRLHSRLASLGIGVERFSTCDDLFSELAARALYG